MPLSQKDLSTLQEMQTLCSELEADLTQMVAFKRYLGEVEVRHQKLSTLYESQWQRLTESEQLSAEEQAVIESMVREGHYSILGQDTIWNALYDTKAQYVELLKALAEKL